MRTGRMVWIVLALFAALAVVATALAQEEPGNGVGGLIERPWTAIVEIWEDGTDWAGEVPFSGETSDFDGRCSVPSDWVFHMRWEGLDSVFGQGAGTGSHCAHINWGSDAEGTPTVMGLAFTDGEYFFTWADGSTLGFNVIDMGMGFDAQTGLITLANFQYSVGDGTGRLAGATLFFVANCRYGSDEAVIAGTESVLCVSVGTVRYDPMAGQGR